MTITAQWLFDHGACEDQVVIFQSEWPDVAEVRRATLARAASLGLRVAWLAQHVMISPSALAEYQRAEAEALAEYRRAEAEALAEFQRAVQGAGALALPDLMAALSEFHRGAEPARAKYHREAAAAIADALELV